MAQQQNYPPRLQKTRGSNDKSVVKLSHRNKRGLQEIVARMYFGPTTKSNKECNKYIYSGSNGQSQRFKGVQPQNPTGGSKESDSNEQRVVWHSQKNRQALQKIVASTVSAACPQNPARVLKLKHGGSNGQMVQWLYHKIRQGLHKIAAQTNAM